MKFIRFNDRNGESYGVFSSGRVLSLPTLALHMNAKLPRDLSSLLDLDLNYFEKAMSLLHSAGMKEIESASCPLEDVTLLAPIPSPGKIVCLGQNYLDHAAEQKEAIPDEPIIFMKPRTAIIGPNGNIVKPSFVNELDYEAELAIVIGRRAKDVPLLETVSQIFGYTIMNDVSARDVQFRCKQWTKGKSFDTFAPMGPCITTINELSNTDNLSIQTWVNGEIRQNSSTRNMVFGVHEIVHHLSRVMTFEPGDIIATGTPAGVGFTLKPHPRFLQSGDTIKIEIQGIGILENKVVNESMSPK